MIRNWLRRRRCFHHDHHTGQSWIHEQIVDWRKFYYCATCGRTWIR